MELYGAGVTGDDRNYDTQKQRLWNNDVTTDSQGMNVYNIADEGCDGDDCTSSYFFNPTCRYVGTALIRSETFTIIDMPARKCYDLVFSGRSVNQYGNYIVQAICGPKPTQEPTQPHVITSAPTQEPTPTTASPTTASPTTASPTTASPTESTTFEAINCGDTTTGTEYFFGFLNTSPTEITWLFSNPEQQDVTITNCGSEYDTMMKLTDLDGKRISSPDAYAECTAEYDDFSDDCAHPILFCDDLRWALPKGTFHRSETITWTQLPKGTFYLKQKPFMGVTGGPYNMQVLCGALPTESPTPKPTIFPTPPSMPSTPSPTDSPTLSTSAPTNAPTNLPPNCAMFDDIDVQWVFTNAHAGLDPVLQIDSSSSCNGGVGYGYCDCVDGQVSGFSVFVTNWKDSAASFSPKIIIFDYGTQHETCYLSAQGYCHIGVHGENNIDEKLHFNVFNAIGYQKNVDPIFTEILMFHAVVWKETQWSDCIPTCHMVAGIRQNISILILIHGPWLVTTHVILELNLFHHQRRHPQRRSDAFKSRKTMCDNSLCDIIFFCV